MEGQRFYSGGRRFYPRLRPVLARMGSRFREVRTEFSFSVPTLREYARQLGVHPVVINRIETRGFPTEAHLLRAIGKREGRETFEKLLYGEDGCPAPQNLLILKGDRSWEALAAYLQSLDVRDVVRCTRLGFPLAIHALSALGRTKGWWVAEYIVAGKDGFPVGPSMTTRAPDQLDRTLLSKGAEER